MSLGVVDWTNVLDSFIAAIPAIIAAVASAIYAIKGHSKITSVNSQIETPSGKPIGEVAEFTHDTSIANNLLLSKHNGPTTSATHDAILKAGADTPQIPIEESSDE